MYDLANEAKRALQSFEENSETLNEILGFSDLNEYFFHPEEDEEC